MFSGVLLFLRCIDCALTFPSKNREGRRTRFMGKTRLKKAKNEELTLREVFGDFINSQEAKGAAAQTVKTYMTVKSLDLSKDNAYTIIEENIAIEVPDGIRFRITIITQCSIALPINCELINECILP